MDLPNTIVFHVDTGSSRALLVDRVLRDPDVPGKSSDEVQAEVDRMLQEGILTAGPNPHATGDQYVVVTEFSPRMAQRLRDASQ